MKKLLLILLCLPMIGFGQIFSNEYLDGTGIDVHQTNDDGYIVLGQGINEWILIKTNQNGDTLWSKKYYNGNAKSILETLDGGYIISYTSIAGYVSLIKTDSNGQIMWQKSYNRGLMGGIIENTDSSLIIAYTENLITPYGYDNINYIMLSKTNSYGDTLWTSILMSYTNGWGGHISDLHKTFDQGYILSGGENPPYSIYTGWNGGALFIKTNSLGNKEWERQIYGGGGGGLTVGQDHQYINSVQQSNDSGYVFCGVASDNIFSNNGQCMSKIDFSNYGKLDSQGFILWQKHLVPISLSNSYGSCRSIYKTFDGNYIIGSYYLTGQQGDVFGLTEIDNDGNVLCHKQLDLMPALKVAGTAVKQVADSAYIVTGYNKVNGSIILIKSYCSSSANSTINVFEDVSNKELLKVTDLLGRETKGTKNEVLFYIYDDGTVEKRIIIE